MSPPKGFFARVSAPAFSIAVIAAAAGCADYAVTFNERPVYVPPGLFRDFSLADPALEACVKQHILDDRVTGADDLNTLDCSHAGIVDLAGLERFTGLRRVRLSANAIVDPSPLAASTGLEILLLDDNRITDAGELWAATALETLSLAGNDELRCPQPAPAITDLTLPAHCATATD